MKYKSIEVNLRLSAKSLKIIIKNYYYFNLKKWQECSTQIFAKTRLLETAKRCRHVGFVVAVDENRSSLQIFRHSHHFADVVAKNARRQAVFCGIGSSQNVFNVASKEWW